MSKENMSFFVSILYCVFNEVLKFTSRLAAVFCLNRRGPLGLLLSVDQQCNRDLSVLESAVCQVSLAFGEHFNPHGLTQGGRPITENQPPLNYAAIYNSPVAARSLWTVWPVPVCSHTLSVDLVACLSL